MEIILLAIAILVLISVPVSTFAALKNFNERAHWTELVMGVLYLISLALFLIGMIIHSNPYYRAIDPIDMACYSPFSGKDAPGLLLYIVAFNIAVVSVWKKSKVLPPLSLTLALIFIALGILVNAFIAIQTSVHTTDTFDVTSSCEGQPLLLFAPISSVLIGVYLIFKVTRQEIEAASLRVYSNKYLNFLNTFLYTKSRSPLWIVLLMVPVFFVVTVVLILFGQDYNSMITVFTDTATWKFSQQAHPPNLDHKGHYLCTVAASGHPKIVKPIRFGQRMGTRIIVNRQLLIANAFEELIRDISPAIHSIIRTNYDKYGFNLSRKINSTFLSSATYIAMKPLEWFFLLCLYLFCYKPEQKINRQYAQGTE